MKIPLSTVGNQSSRGYWAIANALISGNLPRKTCPKTTGGLILTRENLRLLRAVLQLLDYDFHAPCTLWASCGFSWMSRVKFGAQCETLIQRGRDGSFYCAQVAVGCRCSANGAFRLLDTQPPAGRTDGIGSPGSDCAWIRPLFGLTGVGELWRRSSELDGQGAAMARQPRPDGTTAAS